MSFFRSSSSSGSSFSGPDADRRPIAARSHSSEAFEALAAASKLLPEEPASTPEPEPEVAPVEITVEVPALALPAGSVLGPSLKFKGELKADEDLLVLGRAEGSIFHTKTLTIGPEGVVRGDTRARVLIVEGTVDGDLYALESITVRASARVNGNLHSPRVALADGATFNGRIDMTNAARAARAIVERQAAAAAEVAVTPPAPSAIASPTTPANPSALASTASSTAPAAPSSFSPSSPSSPPYSSYVP